MGTSSKDGQTSKTSKSAEPRPNIRQTYDSRNSEIQDCRVSFSSATIRVPPLRGRVTSPCTSEDLKYFAWKSVRRTTLLLIPLCLAGVNAGKKKLVCAVGLWHSRPGDRKACLSFHGTNDIIIFHWESLVNWGSLFFVLIHLGSYGHRESPSMCQGSSTCALGALAFLISST
jgi:hypothetical protein